MRNTPIAVVLLTFFVAPAFSEVPTPTFLANAVRQQGDIHLRVEYNTYGADANGRTSIPNARESVYMRSRQAVYLSEKYNTDPKEQTQSSYDIEKKELRTLSTRSGIKDMGAIRTGLRDTFTRQDMLDPARFPLYRAEKEDIFLLPDWVERGVVQEQQEIIDGFACWRVNIETPNPAFKSYAIWLDSEIGCLPRRVEMTECNGRTIAWEFLDYKKTANGAWFPMKRICYHPDKKTGAMSKIFMDVTKITGDRDFQKDELIVKFASGTPVLVRDATTPITWQ